MKKTLSLATALCVLANGCYFNSAAYLFTQAGYKASANSADIKYGQYVYSYGGEYFVELPRYRQGKEISLQEEFFSKDSRTVEAQPTGEVSMFRIPEDFAMYLTDRAKAPTTPAYMTPVDNADAVKTGERKTAMKQGEDSSHEFDYSSPLAPLWYTVGGLDWLCVDLPVSIAESALASSLLIPVIILRPLGSALKPTDALNPTDDSDLSEILDDDGGFWYKYQVKKDAREKFRQIWEEFMKRQPKYFTTSEADFMRRYARALSLEGGNILGNRLTRKLSVDLYIILKCTPIR